MVSFLDRLRGSSQGKDQLTEALRSLGSADEKIRNNAVKKVLNTGAAVIPALLAIIDSRQVEQQWSETEEMFAKLNHTVRSAIRDLIRDLNSEKPDGIKRARLRLKPMPPDRQTMIKAIAGLEKVKEMSRIQKETAIGLLTQMDIPPALSGHSIQVLLRAVSDEISGVGDPAAKALKQFAGLVEPYLAAELKKPGVRTLALLNLLDDFGANRKETCQIVLSLLSDKAPNVRAAAVKLLGKSTEAAPGNIIPVLVNLKTFKADLKGISEALKNLGARDPAALLPGLSHEDILVRATFAQALGAVGPAASPALHALYGLLKDRDKEVRLEAAKAIALIKPDLDGIPALIDGLSEDNNMIFAPIREALISLGKPVIPILLEKLKSGSKTTRRNAADTLARMGAEASEILPVLEALIEDPDDKVRARAITAIGDFGADAAYLAPKLIEAWKKTGEHQLIRALCQLKEPFAIHILLKSAFDSPRDAVPNDIKSNLIKFAGSAPLTEDLINRTLEASSYQHKYRTYRYDAGYITLELSDRAVAGLCADNNAVTSNILHLVSKKRDISVHMDNGCGTSWDESISFEKQRNKALEELRNRGNPAYDYRLFINNPTSPGR